MANSPNLLGLPVELQIEVAKYLNDDSLRAVHRVCRELAASSLDVFAERFFATRRHLYTTQSLKALRDISKIPRFARHVQCIELVAVEIEIEVRLSRRASRYATSGMVDAARMWYINERCEVRQMGNLLLSQIFTNLEALGVGKELKLTSNLWGKKPMYRDWNQERSFSALQQAQRGVYGMSSLVSSTHPWAIEQDLRPGEIDSVTNDINKALAQTGHPLEVLDLGHNSETRMTDRLTFTGTPSSILSSLTVSWSTLKTLRIGLKDEFKSSPLPLLLRFATSLTELCLDSCDCMNKLGQEIRQDTLTSISIHGIRCYSNELHPFLRDHAKSLKHLHLSNIELLNHDTRKWNKFFEKASRSLNLRSLELRQLSIYWRIHEDPETLHFLPDGNDNHIMVRGEEAWMKQRLAAIGEDGEITRFASRF